MRRVVKVPLNVKLLSGRINGTLLNSIFFGGVVAEGGIETVSQTINGEVIPLVVQLHRLFLTVGHM